MREQGTHQGFTYGISGVSQAGGLPEGGAIAVPPLEPSSSIILPTVMREGKPWGFMMMSGQMPESEKGMSAWATMLPTTPF